MAASSYDDCLSRCLVHEGGYCNDAGDPGGPTNFGITIADANLHAAKYGWIKGRKVTIADMRAMPLSFAKLVYRGEYWDSLRCDDLPAGVDDSVFDYGVNSGIGRSGKVLRRLIGMPDTTYIVTDAEIAAINKRDPIALFNAIDAERLTFLRSLGRMRKFLPGWTTRVNEVRSFSLHLAKVAASVPPLHPPLTPTAPSIDSPMAKGAVPSPVTPVRIGTSGAAVVGAGTVLAQTTSPEIALAAALVGGGAALAWGLWAHRRYLATFNEQQERAVSVFAVVPPV
jgi:lysozyme family protein